MTTRSAALRSLALFWAALHLASPGLTSVAHGLGASEGMQPAAHVEATSSDKCPVVHAPDCGMCRYLSQAAHAPSAPAFALGNGADREAPSASLGQPTRSAVVLPPGRAPPVV